MLLATLGSSEDYAGYKIEQINKKRTLCCTEHMESNLQTLSAFTECWMSGLEWNFCWCSYILTAQQFFCWSCPKWSWMWSWSPTGWWSWVTSSSMPRPHVIRSLRDNHEPVPDDFWPHTSRRPNVGFGVLLGTESGWSECGGYIFYSLVMDISLSGGFQTYRDTNHSQVCGGGEIIGATLWD